MKSHTKYWASLAIMGAILLTVSVSCRTLPVARQQAVEDKEVYEDFNTEDIREAVESASEILRNLEKDVIPELVELGRQFREVMESLAGTETSAYIIEKGKTK